MMTRKVGPSALPLALACSFALACANESATPTGLGSPPAGMVSRGGVAGCTPGYRHDLGSETGEVLETIYAGYDPRWHTVAASIWHFSGYAIAF